MRSSVSDTSTRAPPLTSSQRSSICSFGGITISVPSGSSDILLTATLSMKLAHLLMWRSLPELFLMAPFDLPGYLVLRTPCSSYSVSLLSSSTDSQEAQKHTLTASMSLKPSLLSLPGELRLQIYSQYLDLHRRVDTGRPRPSNAHIRLLRTCETIYTEAAPIMWTYVALMDDWQITKFVTEAHAEYRARVAWVDVANDGHYYREASPGDVRHHTEMTMDLFSRISRVLYLSLNSTRL